VKTLKLQTAALLMVLTMSLPASAEEFPKSAAEFLSRGMQRFRENLILESIEDFNQVARLEPEAAPHLWQRGISQYYAGKFVPGRQQFESHKAVNPHDVENATWHFICVARVEGVEEARKVLIEIDTTHDTRVPMAEIFQLYSGNGSSEAVLKAAEQAGTEQARMYAHLYLGLYYEVAGDEVKARQHIRQAAAAKLQSNYMHQVAKVHLLQRKWDR
jgi:lipoprotein NlpI